MTVDEEDNNNILLDLDSLFDTRLPVVYLIDKDTAAEQHTSGSYKTRLSDSFGNIPVSVFQAFYKMRDKRLLTMALPTKMFDLINEYVLHIKYDNEVNDVSHIPIVYINIYPYKLTYMEQHYVASGIISKLKNCEVKLVNMSIPELTPEWIENNIAYMSLYNGMDWVEYHTAVNSLLKTPLLDNTLLVPTLVSDNIKKEDITKELLDDTMKNVAHYIQLALINNSYYCFK